MCAFSNIGDKHRRKKNAAFTLLMYLCTSRDHTLAVLCEASGNTPSSRPAARVRTATLLLPKAQRASMRQLRKTRLGDTPRTCSGMKQRPTQCNHKNVKNVKTDKVAVAMASAYMLIVCTLSTSIMLKTCSGIALVRVIDREV